MAAIGYDVEVERVERGSPIEIEPCTVCGCREARPELAIREPPLEIVVCGECGLGSLHPMPSPEEVRSFYPPAYYGGGGRKFAGLVEPAVAAVARLRARSVARGLAPGGRILDIGCGRGLLLGHLADRGFEVHGTEVSEEAVEGVDPRVEVRLAWSLEEAGYSPESFDRVVLWHVLEHLRAPRQTLAEIHRLLRPAGRLLVAVPNFSSLQARWAGPDWFHLDPPRHLFHFSLAALERLLADCGFEVVETRHFSLRQNPFGWVQSYLNRDGRSPRCGLYSLLQGARPEAMSTTRALVELAIFGLGLPLALKLSAWSAWARSGATVSLAAEKR